jgi:hypothetical protein
MFTPTNTLYVSFYVMPSSGWVGSALDYHPHMFYLLTTADCPTGSDCYPALSVDRLDAYIEMTNWNYTSGTNEATPYLRLDLQDGANINVNSPFYNTSTPFTAACPGGTDATEGRANFGCNGSCNSDSWDPSTPACYVGTAGAGTVYPNGNGTSNTYWNGVTKETTGALTSGAWHHVETYFQMNTISSGVGQNNGIMQAWVDGVQVLNYTDLIYRTGQNPTMQWDLLVLGPYIGAGSPSAQSLWFDNLTVATSPPGNVPPAPPVVSIQ